MCADPKDPKQAVIGAILSGDYVREYNTNMFWHTPVKDHPPSYIQRMLGGSDAEGSLRVVTEVRDDGVGRAGRLSHDGAVDAPSNMKRTGAGYVTVQRTTNMWHAFFSLEKAWWGLKNFENKSAFEKNTN